MDIFLFDYFNFDKGYQHHGLVTLRVRNFLRFGGDVICVEYRMGLQGNWTYYGVGRRNMFVR